MSQKPKIFMISVVLMGVSSIYAKSATLTEILAQYFINIICMSVNTSIMSDFAFFSSTSYDTVGKI